MENTLKKSLIYNIEKNYKMLDAENGRVDLEVLNPELDFQRQEDLCIKLRDLISEDSEWRINIKIIILYQ